MTTLESSHTVIIPDGDPNRQGENVRNTAENVRIPATLNAPVGESCYLCFRHAEHRYDTKAFFMDGKFYPSERRYLCTIHWLQVWRVMLESLEARVKTQEQLLAEDDSDYEPYYSRADEEADIANAAYWDEVARGVA